MFGKLLSSTLFVAVALALGTSCYDPVHQDDVASLGEEAPGVPEGPTHRPGQHCTTCHGGDGPGDPQWSIAGTVYKTLRQPDPEVGAQIIVTDAAGKAITLTSNSVGNFYVDIAQYNPVFPVSVQVQSGGVLVGMSTTIGRDGGCASCHRAGGDNHYMPAVYINSK